MVDGDSKGSSHWLWLDSHCSSDSPNRSPWLRSTLAELDAKTKGMLKVIEEEADTFAQRAEMYYQKRPELIKMVEDFYRTHRSLAEQFDHMRSEPGSRLTSPWPSPPLPFTKYRLGKSLSMTEKAYDSYSEQYDHEESDESVIDNPELQEEIECQGDEVSLAASNEESVILGEEAQRLGTEKEGLSRTTANEEILRLREEIVRLEQESQVQKEELKQKDEEKREVIRQLSLAMDLLRQENVNFRNALAQKSLRTESKHQNNKAQRFLGRLLTGFTKVFH